MALLFLKALAVGALVHGRIGFVGAHLNGRETAVLTGLAMMGAAGHSAADGFIGSAGLAVHSGVAVGVH